VGGMWVGRWMVGDVRCDLIRGSYSILSVLHDALVVADGRRLVWHVTDHVLRRPAHDARARADGDAG
jgi:hypothetical protein